MLCILLCVNHKTLWWEMRKGTGNGEGTAESLQFESPHSLENPTHFLQPTSSQSNHLMHTGGTKEAPWWEGESGEGKSITSEVRGHQVLPLVQIRHPGLRSLLHNHLGGRRVRMKDTESNLVIFPSTSYSCPIWSAFCLDPLECSHFLFPFTSYKTYGNMGFLSKVIVLLLQ